MSFANISAFRLVSSMIHRNITEEQRRRSRRMRKQAKKRKEENEESSQV